MVIEMNKYFILIIIQQQKQIKLVKMNVKKARK